jgi:hypothetical protein
MQLAQLAALCVTHPMGVTPKRQPTVSPAYLARLPALRERLDLRSVVRTWRPKGRARPFTQKKSTQKARFALRKALAESNAS